MNKSRASRDISELDFNSQVCEMFLNRYVWSQRKNRKNS